MEFTKSQALSSSNKTAWHFEYNFAQSWCLISPSEIHSCFSELITISLYRRKDSCHFFTFNGPQSCISRSLFFKFLHLLQKSAFFFVVIVSIFESLFLFSAFSPLDTVLSVPCHLSVVHLHLIAMSSLFLRGII